MRDPPGALPPLATGSEAALVPIERLGVAWQAGELEHPGGLARLRLEELEHAPGQRVALAQSQEPPRVGRQLELLAGGPDDVRGARRARGDRDDRP